MDVLGPVVAVVVLVVNTHTPGITLLDRAAAVRTGGIVRKVGSPGGAGPRWQRGHGTR
ncbi:hypothetical protein [Streptomyces mexicanus]|uniref:hypothetical protein n=1 Tax=Streptomyces mexicanus TaxID=178566 RepID=UPI0031EB78F7